MEKPLNLPLEVLQSYLQQDVIKMYSKKNTKSFKDSLLFIEKVDKPKELGTLKILLG